MSDKIQDKDVEMKDETQQKQDEKKEEKEEITDPFYGTLLLYITYCF
jgi:hypothetical protein